MKITREVPVRVQDRVKQAHIKDTIMVYAAGAVVLAILSCAFLFVTDKLGMNDPPPKTIDCRDATERYSPECNLAEAFWREHRFTSINSFGYMNNVTLRSLEIHDGTTGPALAAFAPGGTATFRGKIVVQGKHGKITIDPDAAEGKGAIEADYERTP